MELIELLDKNHGAMGLLLSLFAILFLQLLIKIMDIFIKGILKKNAKRDLDIQRAFKALRIIAGKDWDKIRDQIMGDERFNP